MCRTTLCQFTHTYKALQDHRCSCNSGMSQTFSVLSTQVKILDQAALELHLFCIASQVPLRDLQIQKGARGE